MKWRKVQCDWRTRLLKLFRGLMCFPQLNPRRSRRFRPRALLLISVVPARRRFWRPFGRGLTPIRHRWTVVRSHGLNPLRRKARRRPQTGRTNVCLMPSSVHPPIMFRKRRSRIARPLIWRLLSFRTFSGVPVVFPVTFIPR